MSIRSPEDTAPSPRGNPDRSAWIISAMLLVGALQVELVFSKSINWDEFFHFSDIHRHLQGLPAPWLQVPFVWLFFWVPTLPGDNIDHIQLIRLLTLAFEVIVVWSIVSFSRIVTDHETALLSGLAYLTGGYVFLHAFSVRADVIAASLLMVALYIGIARPPGRRDLALIACLLVLAVLSTIKSVLYVPAFIGVLFYRSSDKRQRLAVAGLGAAAILVGSLAIAFADLIPSAGVLRPARELAVLGKESFRRMFSGGFLPQPRWFVGQLAAAPILLLAILLSAVAWLRDADLSKFRVLGLMLLLPLCTVLFYRNAFPYHYAFILPPAVIAASPGLQFLRRRYGTIVVTTALVANAIVLSLWQDRDVLHRQRAVISEIQQVFREPVTYIDDCALLGHFPRAVNRYASGWGLEKYRLAGRPAYLEAARNHVVPLVLMDGDAAGTTCFDFVRRRALLLADEQFLEENYIRHWGNVFVAGKHLRTGSEPATFEIIVPGTYTLEGGDASIDGARIEEDGLVELRRGAHHISSDQPGRVTLRWGRQLPQPAFHWPQGALFTDF